MIESRIGAVAHKTECLIEGKRVVYHACSTRDLDFAKEYNSNMEYIGSGRKMWIDGREQPEHKKLHHFFVNKP